MPDRAFAFVLQPRDVSLLICLFESRILTAHHAAVLFFGGSREAAKKRLKKLKVAGFIAERRRNRFEPAILSLTGKSLALLREHGILTKYPLLDSISLRKRTHVSDLTLRHEVEVLDIKSAFSSAIAQTQTLSVTKFTTWPILNQFEAIPNGFDSSAVVVKPDGFIQICEKEPEGGSIEHFLFLELDRSSETLETLTKRVAGYMNHYRSGEFAAKNGGLRHEYEKHAFRILLVLRTAERRNNLAERLLQMTPPVLRQAYLSTLSEVTVGPLNPIWVRPSDYRDVTHGTGFDPAQRIQIWGYRRNSSRDEFIEAKIKKTQLFGIAHEDRLRQS